MLVRANPGLICMQITKISSQIEVDVMIMCIKFMKKGLFCIVLHLLLVSRSVLDSIVSV